MDPDIRGDAILNRPKSWRPIFGQSGDAQTHLLNQGVKIGDIFLFFGWFRPTKYVDNGKKLAYVRGKNIDKHIIYGYFEIGEIIPNGRDLPSYVKDHVHANNEYQSKKVNCIYVAKDNLSLDSAKKGADVLRFNENLVLTKKGMSRSKWLLPDFFKTLEISYHSPKSWIDGYFKSVDIGQEFVIPANEELVTWTKQLIIGN